MLLLPAVDDEEQLSADRTARDEESSSRTSNIGERQKKHHGQQYNPVGPAFDDADEQELDGRKPTRLKFSDELTEKDCNSNFFTYFSFQKGTIELHTLSFCERWYIAAKI